MERPVARIGTLFRQTAAAPREDPILSDDRYRTESAAATVIPALGVTAYDQARRRAELDLALKAERDRQEIEREAAEKARYEREEKERQEAIRKQEIETRARTLALQEARKRQAEREAAERERQERLRNAGVTRQQISLATKQLEEQEALARRKAEEELDRARGSVLAVLDDKAMGSYEPQEAKDTPAKFRGDLESLARQAEADEEELIQRYRRRAFGVNDNQRALFWRAYLRRIRRWGEMDRIVTGYENEIIRPIWGSSSALRKDAVLIMSWVGMTTALVGLVALLEAFVPTFRRGAILDKKPALDPKEIDALARGILDLKRPGLDRTLGTLLNNLKTVVATHEYPRTVGAPIALYPIPQYLKLRWQLVTLWGADPVVDNTGRVVF